MSNPLCLLPKLIDWETKSYPDYLGKLKAKKRVKYSTRFFALMQVVCREFVAELTILTVYTH
jgi:hypothetical protein